MTLKQKLVDEIKESMKSKDKLRLSVLRMTLSSITNKEIDLRKKDIGLSDEEVLTVISQEVKKRKDSIEGFKQGGRDDLVVKEQKEIEILSVYLPEEMSDEEVLRIVQGGIRESAATNMKDFGNVMKVIMPILKGKASGDRVSKFVREELNKL